MCKIGNIARRKGRSSVRHGACISMRSIMCMKSQPDPDRLPLPGVHYIPPEFIAALARKAREQIEAELLAYKARTEIHSLDEVYVGRVLEFAKAQALHEKRRMEFYAWARKLTGLNKSAV